MPRVLRWTLVLFALVVAVSSVWAQPRGGSTGTATPAPGGLIPLPRSQDLDFDQLLEDPEQVWIEFQNALTTGLQEFVTENRTLVEQNLAALSDATSSPVPRIAALLLGLIVLAFPAKTKAWSWLFAGLVLALILVNLPAGEEIKHEIFGGADMRFMRIEPVGSIVFVAIGALMGLGLLSTMFYLSTVGLGALAGALIAVQIGGADDTGLIIAGAMVGFIATTWAASRGTMLVTAALGAALVVFGLGVAPILIIPIMLVGATVAFARSPRAKQMRQRESLPSLQLKEGKVVTGKDRLDGRHLHDTSPSMTDDRDNPLIKR